MFRVHLKYAFLKVFDNVIFNKVSDFKKLYQTEFFYVAGSSKQRSSDRRLQASRRRIQEGRRQRCFGMNIPKLRTILQL